MKLLIPAALCIGLLSGCSYLGYYKREKPEWAPPEEASKVRFPDSFEGGVHLTGPMVAALEVAANEFLPPGAEVEGKCGFDSAILDGGAVYAIDGGGRILEMH